jgi:hypothetical protein
MGQCYALLRVVEKVVVSLTKDETHPNNKGGSLQPHAGHDYAGTSQANGVAGRAARTEQASAWRAGFTISASSSSVFHSSAGETMTSGHEKTEIRTCAGQTFVARVSLSQ